jgi:hypothetical protein
MTFIEFGNVWQKASTGEMFVPASDNSGWKVPTGYYFQRVTQSQPSVQNPEGPRLPGVALTPWAFATALTALQVMTMLQPVANYPLSLEFADENTQFPLSHREYQIAAVKGNRKARVNAGLLASNIARTTAVLDGKVKQFPNEALKLAAMELANELEREEE